MDFLDNMTQSHEDLLINTGMRYGKGARLKFNEFPYWNEVKEKVVYNHFDPSYGQCITIDISPLIGKARAKELENHFTLSLELKPFHNQSYYQTFLHNGSDIFALHENMPMTPFGSEKFGGVELVIEKTVINSLPTKNYVCGKSYFQTCLKNTLAKNLKTKYNCYIPILSYDKNTKVCSTKIILQTIKTWIYHMKSRADFEDCKNLKPCDDIMYKLVDKYESEEWRLEITFNNKLVTFVSDSYIYTIRSLFADLGGVIGMLLGLSVFGLFETVLDKIQHHSWIFTNLVNAIIGKNKTSQRQSSGQTKAIASTKQNVQIQKENSSEEFKFLEELRGMQEKIRELESRISKD